MKKDGENFAKKTRKKILNVPTDTEVISQNLWVHVYVS